MADRHDAVRDILASHVMFATLPADDKAALEQLFSMREFAPGEYLARQNERMEGVFTFIPARCGPSRPWLAGEPR